MKRLFAVFAAVGVVAGCRDVTEPSPVPLLRPVFSVAASPAWTPIAPLTSARSQHGSAASSDGRILAIEGLGAFTYVRGSEAYDPAAGTWTAIASPGGWCCGGTASGGDGRIYVLGGEWESDGSLSRVSAWDPRTNTWAAVRPLGTTRDVVAAATGPDGRVYALGGAENGDSRRVLASVEVYDPVADSWSAVAPMQQRRWYHAATRGPDGRIYVFGGLDGFTPLTSAEAYDPATDSWTLLAPLPASRYGAAAVAGADGLIYLVGGAVNNGGDGRSVVTYDPAANSWSDAPSLAGGRIQLAATLGQDGQVYATGGFDAQGAVAASVERFNTAPSPPVPTNRPPVASAGADLALECVAGSADALLDGSASSDPDQDLLSFAWVESGTTLATGATPTVRLGLGVHPIALTVSDPRSAADTDSVTVTVRDTNAPVVTLTRLKATLRDDDDRLHLVARVSARDACQDAALSVTVSSNQAPKKDWHRRNERDWKVVPNKLGGFDVYVRAELESHKGDRTYEIRALATDAAGNQASESTTVTVPREKSRKRW